MLSQVCDLEAALKCPSNRRALLSGIMNGPSGEEPSVFAEVLETLAKYLRVQEQERGEQQMTKCCPLPGGKVIG